MQIFCCCKYCIFLNAIHIPEFKQSDAYCNSNRTAEWNKLYLLCALPGYCRKCKCKRRPHFFLSAAAARTVSCRHYLACPEQYSSNRKSEHRNNKHHAFYSD